MKKPKIVEIIFLVAILGVIAFLIDGHADKKREASKQGQTEAEVVEVATMDIVEVPATNTLVVHDKGASFNMVSSSKNSPAPVVPVNPYLK